MVLRICIPDPAQLLIRIQIQGYDTDSLDPDPQQCSTVPVLCCVGALSLLAVPEC